MRSWRPRVSRRWSCHRRRAGGWCKRAAGANLKERPQRKRHRVNGYDFLLSSFQAAAALSGRSWQDLQVHCDEILRVPPQDWPLRLGVFGRGSSEVAGLSFISKEFNYNADVCMDVSHACWGDWSPAPRRQDCGHMARSGGHSGAGDKIHFQRIRGAVQAV